MYYECSLAYHDVYYMGGVATNNPSDNFEAPAKSVQKWRQTIDRFTKFVNGTFSLNIMKNSFARNGAVSGKFNTLDA